jgi:uncharacterized protein (DUF983 family)
MSQLNGTTSANRSLMRPAAAPVPSRHGLLYRWSTTLWALLRQRCPRCRRGQMFRGSFAMNDPCPCCGLLFQREEGYFLGAMYMSFPITSAILIPIYFILNELLPTWHSLLLVPLATALYLPLMPAVFRYSRVLWIYFDRLGDPYEASFLTGYEKTRLEEAERRTGTN